MGWPVLVVIFSHNQWSLTVIFKGYPCSEGFPLKVFLMVVQMEGQTSSCIAFKSSDFRLSIRHHICSMKIWSTGARCWTRRTNAWCDFRMSLLQTQIIELKWVSRFPTYQSDARQGMQSKESANTAFNVEVKRICPSTWLNSRHDSLTPSNRNVVVCSLATEFEGVVLLFCTALHVELQITDVRQVSESC